MHIKSLLWSAKSRQCRGIFGRVVHYLIGGKVGNKNRIELQTANQPHERLISTSEKNSVCPNMQMRAWLIEIYVTGTQTRKLSKKNKGFASLVVGLSKKSLKKRELQNKDNIGLKAERDANGIAREVSPNKRSGRDVGKVPSLELNGVWATFVRIQYLRFVQNGIPTGCIQFSVKICRRRRRMSNLERSLP